LFFPLNNHCIANKIAQLCSYSLLPLSMQCRSPFLLCYLSSSSITFSITIALRTLWPNLPFHLMRACLLSHTTSGLVSVCCACLLSHTTSGLVSVCVRACLLSHTTSGLVSVCVRACLLSHTTSGLVSVCVRACLLSHTTGGMINFLFSVCCVHFFCHAPHRWRHQWA